MPKTRWLLLLVACLAFVLAGCSQTPPPDPTAASGAGQSAPTAEPSNRLIGHLSAFGDLVGTSWVGKSGNMPARPSDHRIAWEPALDGQVVRWLKTVDAVGFAMETLFFWDSDLNKIAFVQLASNGSHAKGTVEVDGRKIALVGVTMLPEGVLQFRQTFELMPNGSLEDRFTGTRSGHVIVYEKVATGQ